MQEQARFEIIGTVTRINVARSGKVTHIAMRVSAARDQFTDVTAFYAVGGVNPRDRIKVTGHIGSKKIEGAKRVGANGREYDVWVADLIAENVEVVEEGQQSIPGAAAVPPGSTDDIPF
jgi:hypothetical protein